MHTRELRLDIARRTRSFKFLFPIRLLELPLRQLLKMIAGRVPRNRRLFLFGSVGGSVNQFGDNAAYLFVYLSKSPTFTGRCVWITGSRDVCSSIGENGYVAVMRWSLRGIWLALRAKTYVVNGYMKDINRWLSDGAIVVNLWHGVPLKRIERDVESGPLTRLYHPRRFRRLTQLAFSDDLYVPDWLLAPSDQIAERCLQSAFAVPLSRCLPFGYPRNDHLLSGPGRCIPPAPLASGDIVERLRTKERVVAYFPTWRDREQGQIAESGFRLSALAAAISSTGGTLLYKPHFNTGSAEPLEGAVVLGPADDVHAYLGLCDLLITDYSSIAFDFLLLDRPVIYWVPDVADYSASRGLYFEPAEMMPGPLISDPNVLYELVTDVDLTLDDRAVDVKTFAWGAYAGEACQRLEAFLTARIVNKEPL